MTLKDFTYVGTLGMGGFGRVELVSVYTYVYIYIYIFNEIVACKFKQVMCILFAGPTKQG